MMATRPVGKIYNQRPAEEIVGGRGPEKKKFIARLSLEERRGFKEEGRGGLPAYKGHHLLKSQLKEEGGLLNQECEGGNNVSKHGWVVKGGP